MLSAKSDVQVDTAEVRVTEWRLAPGSATGHHIHEMDYVIVPVTSGEMTIVAPNGERSKAQLGVGKSYFRKAGVGHDVLNETAAAIVFLEVELKPYARGPVLLVTPPAGTAMDVTMPRRSVPLPPTSR